MIEIIQTNIANTGIKDFAVIEEAPALDIFLGIIYSMIPKLLATISTTV